jgi:phosphoribosylformimino-5-aminoimidazole carboxamide ribotide isomerase
MLSLIVFPAIDLRGGKVVRLRQGDPAAQTVYSDDPVATARLWESMGASWLHIVNLDGALEWAGGSGLDMRQQAEAPEALTPNLRALADIRAATSLPIQYGGGVRSLEEAATVLESGATRVILGTIAVERPEVLAAVLERFGAGRVVVALDARGGKVSTHGWQSVSSLNVLEAGILARSQGAVRALYTDIARDGMMSGVNVTATAELGRRSGLKVIASGGVASLADISDLAARAEDGIEGVVVGQAIYSGALDLAAAIAAGTE